MNVQSVWKHTNLSNVWGIQLILTVEFLWMFKSASLIIEIFIVSYSNFYSGPMLVVIIMYKHKFTACLLYTSYTFNITKTSVYHILHNCLGYWKVSSNGHPMEFHWGWKVDLPQYSRKKKRLNEMETSTTPVAETSVWKVMATVFLHRKELLLVNFILIEEETVTAEVCSIETSHKLWEAICQKCIGMLSWSVKLVHNNVTSRNQKDRVGNSWVPPPPAYSCVICLLVNFHLFRSLRNIFQVDVFVSTQKWTVRL